MTTSKQQEGIGFCRASNNLWRSVQAGDEEKLLTEDPEDSLVGDMESCKLELERRYPVPAIFPDCSGISRVVSGWQDAYNFGARGTDGYKQVAYLAVKDHPVVATAVDNLEIAAIVKNCGPLQVTSCTRDELMQDFPPEDGFFVEEAHEFIGTERPSYGYRSEKRKNTTCILRYEPGRARRVVAARDNAIKRDALLLEELKSFNEVLSGNINYSLIGYRWGGSRGVAAGASTMPAAVLTCNFMLARHNLVFKKHAYRETRAYMQLIRRVADTWAATKQKWSAYPGFIAWLELEMRSAIGRKIVADVKRVNREEAKQDTARPSPRFHVTATDNIGDDKILQVFSEDTLYEKSPKRRKPRPKLTEVTDAMLAAETLSAEDMLR